MGTVRWMGGVYTRVSVCACVGVRGLVVWSPQMITIDVVEPTRTQVVRRRHCWDGTTDGPRATNAMTTAMLDATNITVLNPMAMTMEGVLASAT